MTLKKTWKLEVELTLLEHSLFDLWSATAYARIVYSFQRASLASAYVLGNSLAKDRDKSGRVNFGHIYDLSTMI